MDTENSNYMFKFSIIIAIYNVEDYLRDAINSIINQSMDFENNVQLILIDDGSEDNSFNICLEYQEKFPNNIITKRKENGGQASARNLGLMFAQGKYINFLDSDDYLSQNALNEVYYFFEMNESVIDICAIPMTLFERRNGPHRLNNKFINGNRVIDLTVDANNPLLSASSSFIKYSSIKGRIFDEKLVNLEDALLINKILLEKKKLGVVSGCEYFYRQRTTKDSTVDHVNTKKEYFTDRLKYFYNVLADYCIEVEGKVPKFIQYLFAYDLQWLLKTPNLNIFDSEEEIYEFWTCLYNVLDFIDEDVIIDNENIEENTRSFFLFLIKNERHLEIEDGNLLLKADDLVLDKINIHRIWLDIVEVKNDSLNISGLFISEFNNQNISIKVMREDMDDPSKIEGYDANFVRYNTLERKDKKYLGLDWVYLYNFDVKIPLNEGESYNLKFIVTYHYDNGEYTDDVSFEAKLGLNLNLRLSDFSAFLSKKPYIVLFKNYKLYIFPYNFLSILRYEFSNVRKIIKDKPLHWAYSLVIRLIYYTLYPYYINKRIWLFSDRIDTADDNAKHLFEYASNQRDGINKYFVVEKNTLSYKQLKKISNKVIPFNSLKHRILYLFSEKIISSFVNEPFLNPFYYKNRELYNGFETAERLFLQHGVTKDDISQFIKKYNNNLSLIVTVSDWERESFLMEGYNYNEEILPVLGFPRFDNLLKVDLSQNSKLNNEFFSKQILFMPTWRLDLENKSLFLNSEYYKILNSFLNNEELFKLLKEKGYRLVFKPHAELMKFIDLIDIDENVYLSLDDSYQDLFKSSSILITDYSSVFFDFAYLKKPVIYYQVNDDYHYDDGYFDYGTMGFGELIHDEKDLLDKISFYLENNCSMEDKFKDNVDKFFKYDDDKNCERVYKWILSH